MVGNRTCPWLFVRFADICEHSAFGPRFSGEQYAVDGNIATLRTTDIDPASGINYNTMPRACLDVARMQQHFLMRDDLVMTRSGRVGTTAVFRSYPVPVLHGAFLIRFRLKTDEASPWFFDYFFKSVMGQNLIASVTSGSVQQNINITNIHNLRVPVPRRQIQDTIVYILSTLNDKIELIAE